MQYWPLNLGVNFDRELFQGVPADVVAHPEVIEAYLGAPNGRSSEEHRVQKVSPREVQGATDRVNTCKGEM
jgi:hypothetical protein